MKASKILASLAVFAVAVMFMAGTARAAAPTFQSKYVWATFPGGGRTVTAVYVDLKDPTYRVKAVWAKNATGKIESLSGIAARAATVNETPVAAINGSYFNLSNSEPQGTVMTSGNVDFINSGPVMMFDDFGEMDVGRMSYTITGTINGTDMYPHNWEAYALNRKLNTASTAMNILYTSEFGTETGQKYGTSIVCDRYGRVSEIVAGNAKILSGGFTLLCYKSGFEKRFKIGDRVDYEIKAYNRVLQNNTFVRGSQVDLTPYRMMLGAAQLLVRDGEIATNAMSDGLTATGLNVTRSKRSIVGITKDNVLIIGTLLNATVKETAYMVKSLGCVEAACTDGGRSSGLWVQGKYKSTPERLVSNALVVVKQKVDPPVVRVNNIAVHFENDPFRNGSSTYVPLREIARKCELRVVYNEATGAMTLQRGTDVVSVKINSLVVGLNSIFGEMMQPPLLKNGEPYIPVFLLSYFSATYKFDKLTNTENITMTRLNTAALMNEAAAAYAAGDKALAEKKLKAVLVIDPEHAGANIMFGALCSGLGRSAEAAAYYLTAMTAFPNDTQYHTWFVSEFAKTTEKAQYISKLLALSAKYPANVLFHTLLGDCYAAPDTADYKNAAEQYRIASVYEKDATKKKKYYDTYVMYLNYKEPEATTEVTTITTGG